MPASALAPEQVAIVRVQADEATAAITGVRLAGSMADLIWRIVSAPLFERISQLLKIMDYAGMRSLQDKMKRHWDKRADLLDSVRDSPLRAAGGGEQLDLLKPPLPPPPAPRMPLAALGDLKYLHRPYALHDFSSPYAPPTKDETWQSSVWQTLLSVAPPLIINAIRDGSASERLTALAGLLVVSLPAILALATIVLGLPFGVVSALSLVLIDWSAPLAGPYLRVMAEPSPSGTWRITQFDADREPHGLFHSQAYQNWQAQSFIADWVLERARSVEAARDGSA
jgi:hypothetical protein